MAYLILQKARTGGTWQIATSSLYATEHAAAAAQKRVERMDERMKTARTWVEVPA